MGLFSCIPFLSVFCGSVVFLTTMEVTATTDPLSAGDIVNSYRLDNRHQCQRLCWYWKACSRFSYYFRKDSDSKDNCVLHTSGNISSNLASGWSVEQASRGDLPSLNTCAKRPCQVNEMCIPMYALTTPHCVPIVTDPWLDKPCSATNPCNTSALVGPTKCYSGQCVCEKSYYSDLLRTCKPTCAQLGKGFVTYKGQDLQKHDISNVTDVQDVAKCKTKCLANPACLMVNHLTKEKVCYLKNETPSTRPGCWSVNGGVNIYQRTCI